MSALGMNPDPDPGVFSFADLLERQSSFGCSFFKIAAMKNTEKSRDLFVSTGGKRGRHRLKGDRIGVALTKHDY